MSRDPVMGAILALLITLVIVGYVWIFYQASKLPARSMDDTVSPTDVGAVPARRTA